MNAIKGKNRSETAFITECIKTAGDFALVNALYAADPSDGNFAHEMARCYLASARQSTARLAQVKATSLLALSAKARLARAVVAYDFDMLEDSLAAFVRSFIAETIELIDPLVHEKRRADKRATREGAPDQNGPVACVGQAA
jgi:hypothetical protein